MVCGIGLSPGYDRHLKYAVAFRTSLVTDAGREGVDLNQCQSGAMAKTDCRPPFFAAALRSVDAMARKAALRGG
jgi:hypothetical protein